MRMRWTYVLLAVLLVGCSEGYAPSGEDGSLDEDAGSDAGAMHDGGDAGFDDSGQADGSGDDASGGGDAASGDAGGSGDTSRTDTGSSSCTANHNGKVERDEISLRAGPRGTFKVAEDVTFDTSGTENSDGSRSWDLSQSFAGDRTVLVELRSLDGTWYKSKFPDADYAARLSDTDDKLGVFEATSGGLYLNGVVSRDDDSSKTELTYDPPAAILEFPVEQGATWSSESSVEGDFEGWYSSATATYDSQVDAYGTLKTPYGDFDVLRVRTDVKRHVSAFMPWYNSEFRIFSFVSECFGTVATITSKDKPEGPEFTEAAEIRRLSN